MSRSRSVVECVPVVVVVALLCVSCSYASIGDMSRNFRSCLARCSKACRTSSDHVLFDPLDAFKRGASFQLDTLPLSLRILGWDCEQNCGYECMQADALDRTRRGDKLVQYYGKWPFTRVLGIQEIASTIFSVANFVPHYRYFFAYSGLVRGRRYFLTPYMWWYSLICMNAWLWSTVFHSRDNIWTERLDYYGTVVALVAGAVVAIARALEVRRRWHYVVAPAVVLTTVHLCYMQFYLFDYGWNMKVGVTLAAVTTIAWFTRAYHHPRPYNWKIYAGFGLVWVAGLMEVFDFPPFLGIFDAHSLWHGCTPYASYMVYDFIMDDTKHELRRELPGGSSVTKPNASKRKAYFSD